MFDALITAFSDVTLFSADMIAGILREISQRLNAFPHQRRLAMEPSVISKAKSFLVSVVLTPQFQTASNLQTIVEILWQLCRLFESAHFFYTQLHLFLRLDFTPSYSHFSIPDSTLSSPQTLFLDRRLVSLVLEGDDCFGVTDDGWLHCLTNSSLPSVDYSRVRGSHIAYGSASTIALDFSRPTLQVTQFSDNREICSSFEAPVSCLAIATLWRHNSTLYVVFESDSESFVLMSLDQSSESGSPVFSPPFGFAGYRLRPAFGMGSLDTHIRLFSCDAAYGYVVRAGKASVEVVRVVPTVYPRNRSLLFSASPSAFATFDPGARLLTLFDSSRVRRIAFREMPEFAGVAAELEQLTSALTGDVAQLPNYAF
jgi:hypothetical protein